MVKTASYTISENRVQRDIVSGVVPSANLEDVVLPDTTTVPSDSALRSVFQRERTEVGIAGSQRGLEEDRAQQTVSTLTSAKTSTDAVNSELARLQSIRSLVTTGQEGYSPPGFNLPEVDHTGVFSYPSGSAVLSSIAQLAQGSTNDREFQPPAAAGGEYPPTTNIGPIFGGAAGQQPSSGVIDTGEAPRGGSNQGQQRSREGSADPGFGGKLWDGFKSSAALIGDIGHSGALARYDRELTHQASEQITNINNQLAQLALDRFAAEQRKAALEVSANRTDESSQVAADKERFNFGMKWGAQMPNAATAAGAIYGSNAANPQRNSPAAFAASGMLGKEAKEAFEYTQEGGAFWSELEVARAMLLDNVGPSSFGYEGAGVFSSIGEAYGSFLIPEVDLPFKKEE